MPRLSLFKPEKGNDYKFHDRNINEMFQVGGTDLNLHKYIGPYDQGETNKDGDASPTQPNYSGSEINELTIQDLLFLENRDRKYAPDVYTIRGIYNVQDADFNLSQFGMFLQNDTLFLTVHLNDSVERLGRKPMSGDVIEFPHMKDDFSLDASIPIALKRYYVIEDVNRAAEGFSQTWWPHLLRVKLKSLVDSQEFRDILGDATTEGSSIDTPLWSTHDINNNTINLGTFSKPQNVIRLAISPDIGSQQTNFGELFLDLTTLRVINRSLAPLEGVVTYSLPVRSSWSGSNLYFQALATSNGGGSLSSLSIISLP